MPALARLAMRTRFEIVLADADDPGRLRAAGEAALDEIDGCEALLSVFRPESELFRINALAARQAVTVDARVLSLLERALALGEASDDAFDMATGALLACWDLRGMADGSEGRIPSAQSIASARAACGMRRQVTLDAQRRSVRFHHPGVRLDPGAIGKGYALERAAEILRESGIRNALLHGGTSTVCALGRAVDQSEWTVAIRHPRDPDRRIATAVLSTPAACVADAPLAGEPAAPINSLSVSAAHGKSFTIAGRRYGHVIDPRSGWPVQGALLAAVIHPSAMTSDALSTALLVLGHEGLRSLPERFPTAGFLLVRADEDGGEPRVDTAGTGFITCAAALAR